MSKVNISQHSYKIRAEYYREDLTNGTLLCFCYTPGLTHSEEPNHIEKTVTFAELEHAVTREGGKVWVTDSNDTQNCYPVSFWQWYDDNRNSEELHDSLTDIINKREKRIDMSLPDLAAAAKQLKSSIDNQNKKKVA